MDIRQNKHRGERMEAGMWVDIGRGSELKLRFLLTESVQQVIDQAISRRKRALGIRAGRDLPESELKNVVKGILFGNVVVDWRGVTCEGEPVEFTRENFESACADPSFPTAVIGLAGEPSTFDVEDLEVVEGD